MGKDYQGKMGGKGVNGDDMSNYKPQRPEVRRKRTAHGGYPGVVIPSQMNPATEMTGFDPLLQTLNGSLDTHKEMSASLAKGKQGLGEYDYGPAGQSGEIAGG